MNRTFRVDLLRFEGARPVPEVAALLARHLEVEPAQARDWVTKTPATVAAGISAPEAQGVVARLMPLGAHLLMVNERTGHQTRYPESTLAQRIATGAHTSAKHTGPGRASHAPGPVGHRTKLPPSLEKVAGVGGGDGPSPERPDRRGRGGVGGAIREKLSRTQEARAHRRKLFEARGVAAIARRRLRTISIVGIVAIAIAVALWRAQLPENIAATEVDGPYSFGPAGYDYVER
jgi:hypothetical protein